MPEIIAIVGAGHAAGNAVKALVSGKCSAQIVVIGEEEHLPYQRPPLSKGYLTGNVELPKLYLQTAEFYAKHNIEVRCNTKVTALDCARQTLTFNDNSTLQWDKLLLTTGSFPRKVPVEGSELSGIYYLRTISDTDNIRQHLGAGKRLVIVGAGYIGLEVAASARSLGAEVTVIEMEDRVMKRVAAPEISDYFSKRHAREGVTIHLNTGLTEFRGNNGKLTSILCSDGNEIQADIAIVGVGVAPATELAEAAGLQCDDGIVVNEYAETSVANVYAAGDCTRHPNSLLQSNLRLESVHNATQQARTAANTILGERTRYSEIPWFWSDQYDCKLQICGISQGYDETIVRGEAGDEDKGFGVFYVRGDELIATDMVNRSKEFQTVRKIMAKDRNIARQLLADPNQDLTSLC